jgi:hypothetical protein
MMQRDDNGKKRAETDDFTDINVENFAGCYQASYGAAALPAFGEANQSRASQLYQHVIERRRMLAEKNFSRAAREIVSRIGRTIQNQFSRSVIERFSDSLA